MRTFESPVDRAKAVTFDLVTDRTLPNILLGAFLTSAIQLVVGMVPVSFPIISAGAWVLSVGVYSIADEVREAIEEEKNRLLSPEDACDYYGIE